MMFLVGNEAHSEKFDYEFLAVSGKNHGLAYLGLRAANYSCKIYTKTPTFL